MDSKAALLEYCRRRRHNPPLPPACRPAPAPHLPPRPSLSPPGWSSLEKWSLRSSWSHPSRANGTMPARGPRGEGRVRPEEARGKWRRRGIRSRGRPPGSGNRSSRSKCCCLCLLLRRGCPVSRRRATLSVDMRVSDRTATSGRGKGRRWEKCRRIGELSERERERERERGRESFLWTAAGEREVDYRLSGDRRH